MIKRTEKLVITFPATTQAMMMEACCKACAAPGRLIPVPGSISAGCGLAWCAPPECEKELAALMHENHLIHQGVYRCLI